MARLGWVIADVEIDDLLITIPTGEDFRCVILSTHNIEWPRQLDDVVKGVGIK